MSKSLAQRIAEDTRKVIADQEAKIKEIRRKKVIELLNNRIEELGTQGKPLYVNYEKTELNIPVLDVFNSNKLEWEEAKVTLQDLGFKIHNYSEQPYLALPEDDVPATIQGLLDRYEKLFEEYQIIEENKANTDVNHVLQRLENGKYRVEDVDVVIVNYLSQSESSIYRTAVSDKMKKNGFEVSLFSTDWRITVIQEEGD